MTSSIFGTNTSMPYPKAVPASLGAIARIADSGIPVHYHTGNHDLWTYGYLEEELGVHLHRDPIVRDYDGLTCMIGHGDGLGPGDYGYKRIKKVFTSPCSNGLSATCILTLASRWRISFPRTAAKGGKEDASFQAPENEWLWSYSKNILNTQDIDCFIFGHRHLPLDLEVPRLQAPPQRSRRGTSTWATGFSISPAGKLLTEPRPSSPLIPFASPAQKKSPALRPGILQFNFLVISGEPRASQFLELAIDQAYNVLAIGQCACVHNQWTTYVASH